VYIIDYWTKVIDDQFVMTAKAINELVTTLVLMHHPCM
jgi:hypothetical protein